MKLSVATSLTMLVIASAFWGRWAWAETPRPSIGQVSQWTSKKGEDLLTIAHRHRLAIDHLTFANGWPQTATRIYPETPVVLPTIRVLPRIRRTTASASTCRSGCCTFSKADAWPR